MRPAFGALFAALLLSITALGAMAARQNAPARAVSAVLPGAELKGTTAGGMYDPLHKGGVDLSTGIYGREDEDLVVFDTLPLVLRRTNLVGDRISRQFGVGGTHPGEWYLIGDGEAFQWAALILSTGGRIYFHRTTPGSSARDGIFEHSTTPTAFYGSRLEWTAAGWALRFVNGGSALFRHCNPDNSDICSILELRDGQGHRIEYVRDKSGTLLEMRGDHERIAFEYDAKRRIAVARDSSGRWVTYDYDGGGRLSLVRSSDGVSRTYTYDDHDRMLTIDDPGRHIENEFDAAGRVVKQTIRLAGDTEPAEISFRYTMVAGALRHTDVTDYDGDRTRYTWNASHYMVAKVIGTDSADPVTVTFDRDPDTNLLRGLKVECRVDGAPRSASADAQSNDDQDTARLFVARTCR